VAVVAVSGLLVPLRVQVVQVAAVMAAQMLTAAQELQTQAVVAVVLAQAAAA
jgi:hypothetical protein